MRTRINIMSTRLAEGWAHNGKQRGQVEGKWDAEVGRAAAVHRLHDTDARAQDVAPYAANCKGTNTLHALQANAA